MKLSESGAGASSPLGLDEHAVMGEIERFGGSCSAIYRGNNGLLAGELSCSIAASFLIAAERSPRQLSSVRSINSTPEVKSKKMATGDNERSKSGLVSLSAGGILQEIV